MAAVEGASWKLADGKAGAKSPERELVPLKELKKPDKQLSSPPQEEGHQDQTFRFTVTPVSETSTQNGEVLQYPLLEGDRPESPCGENSANHTLEMVNLRVPDLSGDTDSTYGDTLSQTSITKLLARKFKTYRTCKYDTRSENGEVETRSLRSLSRSRQGSTHNLNPKYESQDYDQCENTLFLKEQETLKSVKIHRKWLARWIVMLLIGVGTALVAVVIEVSISYACRAKFLALKKIFDGCHSGPCMLLPLLVWVIINATLVFLGSTLVTMLEPQAAGSGVPQIKCYLNGVKIPGLLTLRALVAKTVGVILSVSGGLACGKEGPMIHSGAIVAAGISQGRSRLFNFDFKIFEYLRSDTEKRDFVSGGAAAGVSSAFGAPVGGVLFSLEEGASFWNQALTWRIVFASMTATFLINILLSAVNGHPADLSNPGLITFGKFTNIMYQFAELPVFSVMAVFGGLSGALFNQINGKLIIFRKRYITQTWSKILEAVIVATTSAVVSFLLIFLVNECSDAPSHGKSHGQHVQLSCRDGKHNILSAIFFRTPEEAIIAVLHDDRASYSMLSLALFVIVYFFMSCWTCGLSVSSGVFIPSLLLGASWGRLVGMGITTLFPSMDSNIGKYALIGAACQLGGVVRMTISLTVILLECTGNITFGLPTVMSLIIAKWVGDFFNEGLYDLHIHMMGIPLLPWEPPEMSYDITANQVMSSTVTVLSKVETVRNIASLLEQNPHSGFPVVDGVTVNISPSSEGSSGPGERTSYGRCKGLILRSQLVLLLKYKVFKEGQSKKGDPHGIRLEDFRDAYPKHISVFA